MARFSPSLINRVSKCPASAALPQASTINARAERGRAGHEFLAHAAELGRDEALELVAEEYRDAFAKIDFEALPPLGRFASEVMLAFDVESGKGWELGRGNASRDYPDLGPRVIVGTADLVGISDDEVIVPDFKFGYTEVPPAAENLQLRTYALAAARAYSRPRATVAIIRIPDDGSPTTDSAPLDAFALDAFGASLADLVDEVEARASDLARGLAVEVTEGDHCLYCPALSSCPAKINLARAIGNAPVEAILGPHKIEDLPTLDSKNVVEVYLRAKAAKAVLGKVDEALALFARVTPFEVAPGVLYGPRPFVREEILPEAKAAIASVLGPEFVEKAGHFETSKGEIERGVRAWLEAHPGSGKTIKALKDAVVEEARRMGAVKKSVSYPVGEHKAKEGRS